MENKLEEKKKLPFIAHYRLAKSQSEYRVLNRDGDVISVDIQTIEQHLNNTALFASKYALDFGAEKIAFQLGLAHDIGKYSDGFQNRIWNNGVKVDHSSAGAQEVFEINNRQGIGFFAAYCLAGHHAGLMNGGSKADVSDLVVSLRARLNKNIGTDFFKYKTDISLNALEAPSQLKLITKSNDATGNFSIAFWIRMLFSCLVDADYLDTENFADYGSSARKQGETMSVLNDKLRRSIVKNQWLEGNEGILRLRSQVLKNCICKGKTGATGLYSLTVPTGGGKTIASLAFALNHAVNTGKRRVIYVIPYCSIIDQTVNVFSGILGSDNVLAHYSNADYGIDKSPRDTDDSDIGNNSMLLATENWDKPVVVTTAVQFFESLFANKTSKCRKLHNIVNSVIIFDEAQTLPLTYLKPCLASIVELNINYNCTCVLCTATQPSLNRFFNGFYINSVSSTGTKDKQDIKIKEICEDTEKMYNMFKRVTYQMIGEISNEKLSERICTHEQVLCIVSTRKQAFDLFNLVFGKCNQGVYHLSKHMTSEHLKKTIEIIRDKLKNGEKCKVVATSLVEAGVDLDFPVVFRAEAGLDSILQAGGRCNREGQKDAQQSFVYVFMPEKAYTSHMPAELKRPSQIMNIVTKGEDNIAENRVVSRYFNSLYNNLDGDGIKETTDGLDVKHIIQRIEECHDFSIPFADIASSFKIIDSNSISVLIQRDELSRKLAEKLLNCEGKLSSDEYRMIGRYCVTVYRSRLPKISGSVVQINDNFVVLVMDNMYDDNTGLRMEDDNGVGVFA